MSCLTFSSLGDIRLAAISHHQLKRIAKYTICKLHFNAPHFENEERALVFHKARQKRSNLILLCLVNRKPEHEAASRAVRQATRYYLR